ncbi:MAG: hypothetical protein COA79_20885 [Planctomycetota bacterium]|nr:MAG: hypothetical protein COA79_20885 [Planctomycetota bacterium]
MTIIDIIKLLKCRKEQDNIELIEYVCAKNSILLAKIKDNRSMNWEENLTLSDHTQRIKIDLRLGAIENI